jgi:acyl-coenzyme A thioesterase PaaI-like protein
MPNPKCVTIMCSFKLDKGGRKRRITLEAGVRNEGKIVANLEVTL